ncbi:MAG: ComEA family DNA-binding protein [Desulfobulbus sp.]
MKNPTTDPAVALDHGSHKDKRTLVLFLFGLLLLVIDCWPEAWMMVAKRYTLSNQGDPQQVVFDANCGDQGILDPAVPLSPEIPARCALFLHQPLAINRADQKSLELLPGVGPHLAEAITVYIGEHGPMTGPEDLQKVAGVGPKTMERLLPLIHFR